MFIQIIVRVFHVRLSNFVCPSFPFGIEGRMWVVIVFIPEHCLSIYFAKKFLKGKSLLYSKIYFENQMC